MRELLTDLRTLYRKVDEAKKAYNTTSKQLKKQEKTVRTLGGQLAKARTHLADGRDDVGRLARQQYQESAGHLSLYLRLLLSRNLQTALDEGHMIRRAANQRIATVVRLSTNEQRLDSLATKARSALDKQQSLAKKKQRLRDTVRRRLDDVERLLASLTPQELAQVARLDRSRTGAAARRAVTARQTAYTGAGPLGALAGPAPAVPFTFPAAPAPWQAGDAERMPSRAGAVAVAYALEQIGKPYVWGAAGPDAFDCSGLTSQAWAHAGRRIPRTSQAQWKSLPKVAMSQLRPGDLVVYYARATHVALYIGEGQVVHAPRPGAAVKVSPIDANPIRGAVRPDGGAPPLSDYARPDLPPGATAGGDTGFDPIAPGGQGDILPAVAAV